VSRIMHQSDMRETHTERERASAKCVCADTPNPYSDASHSNASI